MFCFLTLYFRICVSAVLFCSIKLFIFVMHSPGMIRLFHRPHGYESGRRPVDIMPRFPFSPQDMEALKRYLAVIESKMAQAKSWLKDPHGQPGNWIISAAVLLKQSGFQVL